MKIINSIFLLLILSGCELLLYRESYTIDRMALWEHLGSKKVATLDIKNECYDHAMSISKDNYKDFYGKCLYNKGFRFKTTSLLYCYHRKKECDSFEKYRK